MGVRLQLSGLSPAALLRPGAGCGGGGALVYHQRLSYAREQAAAGAEHITLPLLPYDRWAINETVGKGDISYLVYREVPWDVAFTFVPWAEYTAP